MSGFSVVLCSNESDMASDHGPSKLINKLPADMLTDETFKKNKTDLASLSNVDDTLLNSVAKTKSFKKVRRPPNAFMLFAKERRCSLDPSIKEDKKCHVNTILGNMWRELSDSEKAKYYYEARRRLELYKKSDTTSSGKILKKKGKMLIKKVPGKSVGRPSKPKKKKLITGASAGRSSSKQKKREPIPETSNLRSSDARGIEKSENESSSSKPVVKVEHSEKSYTLSEPHISSEYPSSSFQHQHNIAMNPFHRKLPSTEAHHSNPCCCSSALHPDASTSRSCYGAGLFPPFLPPYPFNSPFWMYQQAMAHHVFPFPSLGFPSSPFGCSLPYSYNSAYSNTYGSLYSGKCTGSFSYATHSSSSTAAANASIKEEPVEIPKNAENSEDELLVVDEGGPESGQNQDKGTV